MVRSQPLLLRNKRKVKKDHQMDTVGNTIGRPRQVIRQGYLKEAATAKQMLYKIHDFLKATQKHGVMFGHETWYSLSCA